MRPALLAVALLGGCAMSATDKPVEVGRGDCSAEAAQSLVGQQGTPAIAQRAMTLTRSKTMRWLRPNMIMTMDYRSDRLNITLDDSDRITRINCG